MKKLVLKICLASGCIGSVSAPPKKASPVNTAFHQTVQSTGTQQHPIPPGNAPFHYSAESLLQLRVTYLQRAAARLLEIMQRNGQK